MRRGLPAWSISAAAMAFIAVGVAGCGTAQATPPSEPAALPFVLDLADPVGDVRLGHPAHPDIDRRTFDLEHVRLSRSGGADGVWRLEVTFARPVPTLTEVRAARDRVVTMFPQTIDVYLDTVADQGRVAALPGRRFRVAASEGWDRVLVVSSLPDLAEDGVVYARSVSTRGRRIVATFPADAIGGEGGGEVRGALVVVLATAPLGDGLVRPVGRGGDCRVWDDDRCTLDGDGPPVLDALAVDVQAGRPIPLTYLEGTRPVASTTPVVFLRGNLIGAAPVDAATIAKGRLATVLDASGVALGTAVVLSVVGDTASLELVSPAAVTGAHAIVFAAPEVAP